MKSSPELNPSLDGVRGLAFAVVTLFHLNDFLHRPWFLVDGQVGVWIFFVLSSYLLAKPFFSAPEGMHKPQVWWNYIVRRILRIYPLFIVYVVCLFVFAHVPISKCMEVFFLERTHAVDWSLYIECRFYLLLPFLVLPVAWGVGHRTYLIFLGAITVLLTGMFPFWIDYQSWPFGGSGMAGFRGNGVFLSYLTCFLPGIFAAYAAVHFPSKSRSTARWADLVGILVLVALISIPLVRRSGPPNNPLEYSRLIHLWAPYAGLFGVWIYLLSRSEGIFARFLSGRIWRFLGSISYPGYLFNIFVFFELRRFMPDGDVIFVITSLGILLLLSFLLHAIIEVPVYRMVPKRRSSIEQRGARGNEKSPIRASCG